MKIAVFSDIQANVPAMEAVIDEILAWRPDRVIMNGDLVNRGPCSLQCLELFEQMQNEHGWEPLRGNHEDYVIYCRNNPPKSDNDAAMRRFTDFTVEQMGGAAERMLAWPDHVILPDAKLADWVHITHGTLAGNRVGVMRHHSDDDLAGRISSWASLFVTAHTHRPLERQLNNTTILNVGSAGSPFDGDPRGSWAKLEHNSNGWQTEIIRFDYDRNRAEQDYHDTGFLEQGGPIARMIYEEWKQARSLLPHWRRRYLRDIGDGRVSVEGSVEAFLAQGGFPDNTDTRCCV